MVDRVTPESGYVAVPHTPPGAASGSKVVFLGDSASEHTPPGQQSSWVTVPPWESTGLVSRVANREVSAARAKLQSRRLVALL